MEIILKYKKVIARSLGVFLLLIGFVVHFWITPKEGASETALAAANVARMEASVAGVSTKATQKPESSHFIEKLKARQKKQLEYLTIFLVIVGAGALGYSFIKRD